MTDVLCPVLSYEGKCLDPRCEPLEKCCLIMRDFLRAREDHGLVEIAGLHSLADLPAASDGDSIRVRDSITITHYRHRNGRWWQIRSLRPGSLHPYE